MLLLLLGCTMLVQDLVLCALHYSEPALVKHMCTFFARFDHLPPYDTVRMVTMPKF